MVRLVVARRVLAILGLVVFVIAGFASTVSAQDGDPVDTTPPAPTTTAVPPDGPPIGKLTIPKIELDTNVYSGITNPSMSNGVGHYPNTAQPGQIGNVGIAGHRSVDSAPFARLPEIVAGDQITITMTDETVFTYTVTEVVTLPVDDPTILATTTGKLLTLTAAEGDGTQQFVVRAAIPGSEGLTEPLSETAAVVEGPAPTSEDKPGSTGMYVFGMLAVVGFAGTVLSFARR